MSQRSWTAPRGYCRRVSLGLVVAGLLILTGQAARAQTVTALTLQDCLQMAFEKQPALAAARGGLSEL